MIYIHHNDSREKEINSHIPIPKSLTILGGPSKAENRTVMRPFSLKCEIVSIPDPDKSCYTNPSSTESYFTYTRKAYLVEYGVLVKHLEGASQTLWRDIDMTGRAEWGGCDPEYMLEVDPVEEVLWYFFVEFAHRDSCSAADGVESFPRFDMWRLQGSRHYNKMKGRDSSKRSL